MLLTHMASSLTLKLYWAAPYAVKCCLASWHARRRGRARFGRAYGQIVRAVASRDYWEGERFIDYQQAQLRALIAAASAHVPYYRTLFGELGIEPGSIRSLEDLRQLPIVEKQTVREQGLAFLDERQDPSKLIRVSTSGTTGTPLNLYRTEDQEAAAFAYFDVRCHGVAGVARRRNRSVSLGGHLVAAPGRRRPPFWVHNRHWNQLYMSSYHLSRAYLPHYVDAIRQFQPEYIEGYPSSLYAIARFMLDRGVAPIPLAAAFTTAENLFDHQREAIGRAFGCRTFSQYGCGEEAVFAAECEQGRMHLSPDVAIVEIVGSDDQPLPLGEAGALVGTSLVSRVQPFIRYRVGDVAALSPEACPCGRRLPVLEHVVGRIDDVLVTRDGRQIGRLDPVFKGADGIAEAQIIQDDYDKFRIRVVPSDDYTEADGRVLVGNLSRRTGPADIRIELVRQIERTSSGKFSAVLRRLPGEEGRSGMALGQEQDGVARTLS